MSRATELKLERLERALRDTGDRDEQDAIRREIREVEHDLGRELSDEERWREQDEGRG